ncbi:hypothetical protein MVEG_00141 [Podila verticillata NRRL 6337]|nr:hypothetical protein MVEG_00141 [Podila verticillata NRRL 6337]
MDVAVPPVEPVAPVPTLGELALDKLYSDETHKDVLFVIDSPSDATTTTGGSDVTSDTVLDSDVDARKSTEYPL